MSSHPVFKFPNKEIHIVPGIIAGNNSYTIFDLIRDSEMGLNTLTESCYITDAGLGYSSNEKFCDIAIRHGKMFESLELLHTRFDDKLSDKRLEELLCDNYASADDSVPKKGNTFLFMEEHSGHLQDAFVDINGCILKNFNNDLQTLRLCVGNEAFMASRLHYYQRKSNQITVSIDAKVFDMDLVNVIEWFVSRESELVDFSYSIIDPDESQNYSLFYTISISMVINLENLKKAKLFYFRNDFEDVWETMRRMLTPEVQITIEA